MTVTEAPSPVQIYASAAPVYREAGWAGVLPLPTGKKSMPPTGFTGKDGIDPDDDQIAEWCRTRGNGNVALRIPDGIIGIDVDQYDKPKPDGTVVSKRGADQLAEIETELGVKLPPTWMTTARPDPSGIRWFQVPPGVKFVSELSDSIEILQRHHRYAVVPPSVHPEGEAYISVSPTGERVNCPPILAEFAPLPPEWVDLLRDRCQQPAKKRPTLPRPIPPGAPNRTNAVQKVLDSRRSWTESSRHPQARDLSMALARLENNGHPGATEALEIIGSEFCAAIAGEPGRNPDREWRDLLEGARKLAAETMSTTPEYAEIQAERDQRPHRGRQEVQALGGELGSRSNGAARMDAETISAHDEAAEDDLGAIVPTGPPGMLERLRRERLSTSDLMHLPPPIPLIKGWLYEGTTNIIYGRPKCGKTLVVMDLAMSLATGTPWRGIELDPRPVLYLIGEGSAGLGSRSRAWAYQHGVDLEDDHAIHFVPVSFTLNSEQNASALASLVADLEDEKRPEGGYRLIVFDTLARYSAGVEENSSAMQTIIDRIDWVRRSAAPESTALIVHHTNAAGDKRSRGHSATDGAVDLGLFVSKADDVITTEVMDFRNGPEGDTHRWRLVTVPEAREGGEDYDPPTVVVDDRTESTALPKSRREALADLAAIQVGDEWISSSRWEQATDIKDRTFHRAKKDLVGLQYVEVNTTGKHPTYRVKVTDIDSDSEVT